MVFLKHAAFDCCNKELHCSLPRYIIHKPTSVRVAKDMHGNPVLQLRLLMINIIFNNYKLNFRAVCKMNDSKNSLAEYPIFKSTATNYDLV